MNKILFVMVLSLFWVGFTPFGFSKSKQIRIFVVQSGEVDSYMGKIVYDGIIERLGKLGFERKKLNLKIHYMNCNSINHTLSLIENDAEKVIIEIDKFKANLLLTIGDSAFEHVGLRYSMMNLPVVFTGIKVEPEIYDRVHSFMDTRLKPGKNITGVYEKLYIIPAIQMHLNIDSSTKKVVMITDRSTVGKAIAKQAMIGFQEAPLKCSLEVASVRNWNGYMAKIKALSMDKNVGAIYPAVETLIDDLGVVHGKKEIVQWTIKKIKKPELALNEEYSKLGYFGGLSVDYKAMGEQTADIVVKVLKGAKPGTLSIKGAKKSIFSFNLERAKELSITIPDHILTKE